jgi:hypothetical protein
MEGGLTAVMSDGITKFRQWLPTQAPVRGRKGTHEGRRAERQLRPR